MGGEEGGEGGYCEDKLEWLLLSWPKKRERKIIKRNNNIDYNKKNNKIKMKIKLKRKRKRKKNNKNKNNLASVGSTLVSSQTS